MFFHGRFIFLGFRFFFGRRILIGCLVSRIIFFLAAGLYAFSYAVLYLVLYFCDVFNYFLYNVLSDMFVRLVFYFVNGVPDYLLYRFFFFGLFFRFFF